MSSTKLALGPPCRITSSKYWLGRIPNQTSRLSAWLAPQMRLPSFARKQRSPTFHIMMYPDGVASKLLVQWNSVCESTEGCPCQTWRHGKVWSVLSMNSLVLWSGRVWGFLWRVHGENLSFNENYASLRNTQGTPIISSFPSKERKTPSQLWREMDGSLCKLSSCD